MRLIRLLLFPFSFLYGLAIILRNLAYDCEILKSSTGHIPVISVGNLTVGGSGKSPTTAYLASMLKKHYKLAILSRGYGRETKGFLVVHPDASSKEVGDEPLQFKHQFPDITVAVCENRLIGIQQLERDHELILLDDAYQHRAIKPGLSILLFDFNKLFQAQWLLPTGDLREPLWGRKRADIVLVTKTPSHLTQEDRMRSISKIDPYPHQKVFFSYLEYGSLQHMKNASCVRSLDSIHQSTQILLLTGIANADPLLQKLKYYSTNIDHHQYPDHHIYSKKNISNLVSAYHKLAAPDKLIITTEKDAQRLKYTALEILLDGLPLYYLPVQTMIHRLDKQKFDGLIETFAMKASITNSA